MQQSLGHYWGDTYYESLARGDGYFDYVCYESTAHLLSSTGYSPELIKLLRDNYEAWCLLIDTHADTLFVGHNSEGVVVAYGYTAILYEWLLDITLCAPNPIGTIDCVTWGSLWDSPSMGALLSDLEDASFFPDLCLSDVLRPAQTYKRTVYWYKFLSTN